MKKTIDYKKEFEKLAQEHKETTSELTRYIALDIKNSKIIERQTLLIELLEEQIIDLKCAVKIISQHVE